MSVLNDKEIERYCREYQLMKHYDKKKIKNRITVKMASNNACCHNSSHNDFDSNY